VRDLHRFLLFVTASLGVIVLCDDFIFCIILVKFLFKL
jgi:hypothetical protein